MQNAVSNGFDDSDPRESAGGEARLLALRYERGFSSEPSLTVGLEEELILVDSDSLLPVDAVDWPFFEGHPSGLASTRLKLSEDLPRSGIPPAFDSWQDLAEFVVWAARGGLFPDLSYLWWDLRPRPDYGTLELRIADAQTTP